MSALLEIPLFPLSSIVVPYGRMQLQIFEQRYINLVTQCMKSSSGFGVAWIEQGYEVVGTTGAPLQLGEHGTYVEITDWDQLANGLLGITIEGRRTFALDDTHTLPSQQIMGAVTLNEAPHNTPLAAQWSALSNVLKGLEAHPHVQGMNLKIDYDDAWQVAYHLIQLLPLDESLKYQLLGAPSLDSMLGELDATLSEISG
jgi:Lon protease-like protein